MIFTDCKLLLDTGDVFAEVDVVDLKFRAQSTTQPDTAALWYGTLIPAAQLAVSASDLFSLQISETVVGGIQICEPPNKNDNTIQFNGVADRPFLTDPPVMEPATKTCDECNSPFFAPASHMDGLCPECAHHLYGYLNCDHVFSQGTCSQCGWDGSVSEYIHQIKLDEGRHPD